MSDTPFSPEEEAQFYQELGLQPVAPEPDEVFAALDKEEVKVDVRPNPASAVVVQVPDISEVEFDDSLIEHLDLGKPQERAEASRVLFSAYGAAAYGIPKGTHRTNWNALVHQRISMHLGRRKASQAQAGKDSLQARVSEASAQKVADTAAISTQAALKVLKDQILGEDGQIDMARFAELLKEA